MELEEIQREAEFADTVYARELGNTRISERMFARYEHPHQMWDWRQRGTQLLGDVRGKDLLDYGCGQGEEAAYFAKLGARVTAIDVSEVGIRVGKARAAANGLPIDFRVMCCTPTEFPDQSFDVVHGLGILHHVGVAVGLAEVNRLLRPGGQAVFLEPLGSSPRVEASKRWLYNLVRKRAALTPVTPGEKNLNLSDVDRECARWPYHKVYTFRLVYRARKLLLPGRLRNRALRFDHALLTLMPPLRRFAGASVIYVRK